MLSKLHYNNILSVKIKSDCAIDGFRNAKVSNLFVDIIMIMYADKDVSSLIKDLSLDEKNIMNSIMNYFKQNSASLGRRALAGNDKQN